MVFPRTPWASACLPFFNFLTMPAVFEDTVFFFFDFSFQDGNLRPFFCRPRHRLSLVGSSLVLNFPWRIRPLLAIPERTVCAFLILDEWEPFLPPSLPVIHRTLRVLHARHRSGIRFPFKCGIFYCGSSGLPWPIFPDAFYPTRVTLVPPVLLGLNRKQTCLPLFFGPLLHLLCQKS